MSDKPSLKESLNNTHKAAEHSMKKMRNITKAASKMLGKKGFKALNDMLHKTEERIHSAYNKVEKGLLKTKEEIGHGLVSGFDSFYKGLERRRMKVKGSVNKAAKDVNTSLNNAGQSISGAFTTLSKWCEAQSKVFGANVSAAAGNAKDEASKKIKGFFKALGDAAKSAAQLCSATFKGHKRTADAAEQSLGDKLEKLKQQTGQYKSPELHANHVGSRLGKMVRSVQEQRAQQSANSAERGSV